MPRRRKRLDPAYFQLPVDRLRGAVSSDRGAARVREVLLAGGPAPRAMVQISAERPCVLGGTDEVIALLKLSVEDWARLSVCSLYDGDRADVGETVMTIEGPYDLFAPLEPLILGTLARRSRVSTNARAFVEAARPKWVMAFPARHDHWLLEAGDALAAQIGGALILSPDPTVTSLGPSGGKSSLVLPPLALMPHALIGAYGGDTLAAARAFAAHLGTPEPPAPGAAPSAPPDEVQLVVPVDYDNDAVRTALDVARALEGRLWGVQLATPENLVDTSIIPMMGTFVPTGVNAQLVWNVRNALDAEGLGDVKLLASSGVTLERIRQFEEEGVPVDAYGIGAALLVGRTGFTAAVVQLDRPLRLRVGSELRANSRLEKVK
jgi:nicotinate phosphoribosyltransferase